MMYHYLYRITNINSGKIYIGVHSTHNINDGYMGSGVSLREDYRKHGKANFTKKIIKVFPTREAALCEEAIIVDLNFVNREDTYNLIEGGGTCAHPLGTFVAKNKAGEIFIITKKDPRYLSGELFGNRKGSHHSIASKKNLREKLKGKGLGTFVAKNEIGETFVISKDDPRYLSGELVGVRKGMKHSSETRKVIGKKSKKKLLKKDSQGRFTK